jgi:hypothetical protein
MVAHDKTKEVAMRTVTSLLATLLLVPCTTVLAQELPRIEQGTRVRLTAPTTDFRRLVATVISADGDTLVVLSDELSYQVPFTSITKLEVARQRGGAGSVLQGLGIGLASGTAAGALFVQLMGLDEPEWNWAIPFAVEGALLGTTIGYGGASAARGMLHGFLFGAFTGAMVFRLGYELSHPSDLDPGYATILGASFGAAAGLVIGPIVGAVRGGWQEVPLERVRVSFAPQRDGRLALGVSVRF